jgi:coenzyme F420-0:L-glutamate ligase/coenzyme F420-1:gamma-L-glutamate ligase
LARTISVIGFESIGLVSPGDDVAHLIVEAMKVEGVELMDDDVIVISQKIISKAEGLLVDISSVKPSRRAISLSKRTKKDSRLIELILRDSGKVLRVDKEAVIVRRKNGFVCLNAGVDKSNVEGRTTYSRLPQDPDSSAGKLRARLEQMSGKRIGVIIADTYSRAFRVGQVEFAIGVSGIEPIVDYRGHDDLFGHKLKFKYVALADEVAAAAELVMGQGTERVPVALVRGLNRQARNDGTRLSAQLLLGRRHDLFVKIL